MMIFRTILVVALTSLLTLLPARFAHAQFLTPVFYIGIDCFITALPIAPVRPIAVRAGMPITLVGYACGTTPPTNEANLSFSSSDALASLPPRYRFLPGSGVVMGAAVLNTPGLQIITATDAANSIASSVPYLVTLDAAAVPTLSWSLWLTLIALSAMLGVVALQLLSRRQR